jgi:hypothetical protein
MHRLLCTPNVANHLWTTRELPFDYVTEFLRSAADREEDISVVHTFSNKQYRTASCPSPRLRFKQGQVVWVLRQSGGRWLRATVWEAHVPLYCQAGAGVATHVAAYYARIISKSQNTEDLDASGEEFFLIAHDCDYYIRKKRPPPPPAPGPVLEEACVALQRRDAHDRREAMERARELENERQRKAHAKEEKRRREEEEERKRLSSVHAAQAAARAATREPAPWPADMPLCGEGSDAPARARRETEKAKALARVSEHWARL